MISLIGHSCAELEDLLVQTFDAQSYRGRQIYDAIFTQGAESIDAIACLPLALRHALLEHYSLKRPSIDDVQCSKDGTRKYRFIGDDHTAFEAVYIPKVTKGGKTNALCVSSQTGCNVGCRFCFTASLTRNRNLTVAEIIGQVLAVQGNIASLGHEARVSNVVFMGMGEPLLNYDHVVSAARLLIDNNGLNFSSRRVTISTAGIVPRIVSLGHDVDTQLAISLNATTDEVRDRIMPINKKWPIAMLLQSLRDYPLKKRRRFTIEYVLLKDINDSDADAKRLVTLLSGIPVKVNLLPLNAHERTPFVPPTMQRIEAFANILRSYNINTLLRTPRGQDIAAACGQLGEAVTLPEG